MTRAKRSKASASAERVAATPPGRPKTKRIALVLLALILAAVALLFPAGLIFLGRHLRR